MFRSRRQRPFLLSLLLALLAHASPARAGEYEVFSCSTPAGPAGLGGWIGTPRFGEVVDRCASGGFFGGSTSSTEGEDNLANWTFTAPPGTVLTGFSLARAVSLQDSPDYRGDQAYRLAVVVNSEQNEIESCESPCAFGDTFSPFGTAGVVERSGLQGSGLSASISCPACHAGYTGRFWIYRSRITLRDDNAPHALSPPRGELLGPLAVSGTRAVEFSARDEGGGLEAAEVWVDGRPFASGPFMGTTSSCARPFTTPTPCPALATARFSLDTRQLPDGLHRVEFRIRDAAGNTSSVSTHSVATRNHGLGNGGGASREARLTTRFVRGTSRAVVGFGRTRALAGRLVGPTGSPISSAAVGVLARISRPGAGWRELATVRTSDDGRFRYTPRPGPSRRFRFAYRAFDTDPVESVRAEARLQVRAGVRLTVSPRRLRNGRTARFRVQLLGGPNRHRAVVSVQVVRPQRTVFATKSAGWNGVASITHRFRYTYRRTTYAFRALVPAQQGYPYLSGRSRIVKLTVRP